MAVNDLSFNQLSTVLNSIVSQATGKTAIAPTNTNEFVSVAQTALKTGYDPLLGAISQVLSNTIFSTRPYSAKMKGLQVTNQRYGNITRKLNISDKDFSNDVKFDLVDGASVDMYKVNKPQILQTNFYGANIFTKDLTIFKDQLDCAFSSPDEFQRFTSMVLSNASDLIEQGHENLGRATIGNFIGGKLSGDTGNVVHLLTEYNALTGLTLTTTTVYQPDNFKAFIQWVFARIAGISSKMTERSLKYHINVTGKEVTRHTPIRNQKIYLYADTNFQISSMVLSNTFNQDMLKMADFETVNFWQSIDTPDTLNVNPVYLKADGTLETAGTTVNQDNIFGVIFDEEALGYTTVNQWSAPTPFNASGGYSNIFYHYTDRYWNDFTENGVVLLLD